MNAVVIEQKRIISNLQAELHSKDVTLNEILDGRESQHNEEIKAIVGRNKQLLEEQNKLLKKVPESLKVSSASLARAKKTEDTTRKEVCKNS